MVAMCLPDTAMLISKHPFFIPDFTQDCRAQLCMAVRINRLGKSIHERFAHRYYDEREICPALHFVAQDRLDKLQKAGLPWDVAVGFDNAVAVCFDKAEAAIKNGADAQDHTTATLRINQEAHVVQLDWNNIKGAIDKQIEQVSLLYTLRQGDLLLLPVAADCPQVHINDKLTLCLDSLEYFSFNVK